MFVAKAARKFLKVRLTKIEVALVRGALNCKDRPIQYAGAIMFGQGYGWYEISTRRIREDWATDEQLMKGMIRKLRAVLAPVEVATGIDYTKANIGRRHIDTGMPVFIDTRPQEPSKVRTEQAVDHLKEVSKPKVVAAAERLEALQRRINNKFHCA